MKFKIGDVVRLKSGGPSMTVGNILSESVVRATWFVGDKIMRAFFHTDQLVKAS